MIIPIYEAVLIILAVLEILSAALIFYFKNILHVGIALSVLFFFNSVIFLIAQQPLLAIIQLFIMIGGISTYFIIGVASLDLSNFKHIRIIPIIVFFVIMFLVISLPLLNVSFSGSAKGPITTSVLASEFVNYIGVFYLLTLLIFAAGLGSIAMFNRVGVRK